MDIETLQFRSECIKRIRSFFDKKNYLELDTPALSETLIPETCLEVFKTEYIPPENSSNGEKKELYLVPSPEIFIKKIIAEHKVDVFQVSKCYRNTESLGRIHNPEFTMLEYYTMEADYEDSMLITEELFLHLLPPMPLSNIEDNWASIRPPFIRQTMDEAFEKHAGFKLSECTTPAMLAKKAAKLGLEDPSGNDFQTWGMDDIYELIFIHTVEPKLIDKKPIFLTNYPSFVPCLAKNKELIWKERWELYINGVELANCYSEEIDSQKIKDYFENEGDLKNKTARVPHAIDTNYWKIFEHFPNCSGVAMGVDRLIAILGGFSSIEPVLPFRE